MKKARQGANERRERARALERQVERVQRRLDMLTGRSNGLRSMQLLIFIGGVLVSVVALLAARWLGVVGFVLVGVGLLWAIRVNRQVDRSIVRHRIWLRVKQAQLARMRLDWDALPASLIREHEEDRDHPFEVDLDITGERSLHRLLDVGVSFDGRYRLLRWLLNTTPDTETIQRRQALVRELAPMSLFREKLMLHSLFATRYAPEHLDGDKLLLWLDEHSSFKVPRSALLVPTLLSVLTLALVVLYLVGQLAPVFFLLSMLLSLGWYLATRKSRGNLMADAQFLRESFGQLNTIFSYLEMYPYGRHERVRKLCEPFFVDRARRPSVLLNRLSRLASAAVLEQGEILGLVVNALLPWDVYVAYQLNRCREQVAQKLPIWLDAWFELEALSSLANFAYLNPDYTLPEIVEHSEQVEQGASSELFCATSLGHPLIAAERKVTNDVRLDAMGEIMMVTGSNMAGKSTFLRTLGINLCLAYAGGPVNAARMQTGLFTIYACIKVSDSLADGYSYFYAEVRRLKGLLTKLEQNAAPDELPVLYLIDEIFKGTNNYERLIGSRAYIRSLVGKHGVGAISTHDLELVRLSDTLPVIQHFHFREEVIDGKLVFDYRLRPGPCPTRNALKIMQLEGLPVE